MTNGGGDRRRFDLLVRGGTVVTPEGVGTLDVGARDGKIVAVEVDLDFRQAERVIEADGHIVVPGGIDVHTHFGNTVGEHGTADDYESGTISAAFGGITTVINYCIQQAGEQLVAAVERELETAEPKLFVDLGLHLIVTDANRPHLAEELRALVERGCPSIKLFTAVDAFMMDDASILKVLEAARGTGVLVNLHAEDGALVHHLTNQLVSEGALGISSLPKSRPASAEALAITKVAVYAGALSVPLYVVHVSSKAALQAIRDARGDGVEVYAETRPAYLFLDDRLYEEDEQRGRFVACWPPLRSPDDQAALWSGLADGTIQTYATDHTSWMAIEKLNAALSFDAVPGGFANVETSLGMLYCEGVLTGRLSLERFVDVTATNPARIFGLWPEKGAISVGADADLCVIDPTANRVIDGSAMHSRSDVEPYEGYHASAWPVVTVALGEVIVDHGVLSAEPARGRFRARHADVVGRRIAFD